MMVTATSAMRMKVNVDPVDDDVGGVGGVDVMLDVFIIMRRGTIVDGGEDVVGKWSTMTLISKFMN